MNPRKEGPFPRPRIIITGENAGTGGSTQATLLSKALDLPRISSGTYFRGLANRFAEFQKMHSYLTANEQYRGFLNQYQSILDKEGLEGITHALQEAVHEGADEQMLAAFGGAIKKDRRMMESSGVLWDYIVDQQTLQSALQKPGFVWEGKLSILLLKIDEMQTLVQQSDLLTLPYLSVLLRLNPEIAAQRITSREGKKASASDVMGRKNRDWERFSQLYSIRGIKVKPRDLSQANDHLINTENITPPQIATEILKRYLLKIHNTADVDPQIRSSFNTELTDAIEKLRVAQFA